MRKLRNLWRGMFDVREGELGRALFMSLCFFFLLFAHYIVKPLSRAMFVTKFDIDRLPYLYILIAVVGGLLAAGYTRVALRASLQTAVACATGLSAISLAGFWWLLFFDWKWLLYAWNLFANLFGAVMVAQAWLVAANSFTSREAKRLYGFVGLGAVAGSWIGAAFTAYCVDRVNQPRHLILVAAIMVILAYVAFRLLLVQRGVSLASARAARAQQSSFSSRDILATIGRVRHLQLIAGIIVATFVVGQLVEFQMQAAGKLIYKTEASYGKFLATYYLYQNIVAFALQSVLVGTLIRRLGVGGTLQAMPVSITAASLSSLLWPGVSSAQVARLTQATTTYTVNKTAMELLYLPLPVDLRNRTKAFVDVFGDRVGKGLAATLLILLGKFRWNEDFGKLPLVVIVFCVVWSALSWLAQKEYVLTIRKRLDARRLDLESARITVGDPAMLALVEQAARSSNHRQACYALSLLAEAPGYPLEGLLEELAGSPDAQVRGKVYELARPAKFPGLLDRALDEIRSCTGVSAEAALKPAVGYVLTMSPTGIELAREFLEHSNILVTESTLEAIPDLPEAAQDLVSREWLSRNAAASDPERRRLAAVAVGVHGDEGTEALHRLLEDFDPRVVAAACHAAGRLSNRSYLNAIVSRLGDSRVRGAAIEALAAYGTRISGTLADILEDGSVPVAIRRQIPRVLRMAPEQRHVDLLLRSIGQPDLSVRAPVLKALNKLREAAPALDYGSAFVTRQILSEARTYFELNAALAPFRDQKNPRTAAGLLAASIEERLKQTLERLFRLLGLRYPPKEIYAAYLAVNRGRGEQHAAALDFLENVLDRDLKRIVVPLLDDTARLAEQGRKLLGVEVRGAEQAIRELIRSGDPWLVACAMAAASELKFQSLAPDIREAARNAGAEIASVALAAQAALA